MIVNVIPSLRPGGAERAAIALTEALVTRGEEACVVVFEAAGSLGAELPGVVRVVDLGASRVSAGLLPLRGKLGRVDARAVVSHLTHVNLACIAALATLRSAPALIAVEHNTLSMASSASALRRDRLYAGLARFAYPKVDAVAAVSRNAADDLDRWCGFAAGRTAVVRNIIDADRVRDRSRESIGRLEGRTVLGVGRLVPQKDFGSLIRACALLPDDVQLVILGEGPERPSLETLAGDLGVAHRVHLMGHLDNPYPWMSQAHVVASSSRYEGMPTVLIEALVLGTRVVATDCPGGTSEIVSSTERGRLVPVGSVDELAAALEAELEVERPVDADGLAETHSREAVVGEYLALIERAIHGG